MASRNGSLSLLENVLTLLAVATLWHAHRRSIAFENEGRRANPKGIIENYYFDYLCSMEYLTESERLRLEQIWEDAHYNDKDEFPKLCNGYYE